MRIFLLVSALVITLAFQSQGQWISSAPEIVALQDEWGNLRPRLALDGGQNPMVIWYRPSDHSVHFSRRTAGSFSPPVQLSPEGAHVLGYDWYGPEIASSGDDVYVVYKEMSEETGPIYILHSSDAGSSWSEPVVVDSSSAIAARMPTLACSADGRVYVAYMLEDIGAGISEWVFARSDDHGATFGDPVSLTAGISGAVCDCCPATIAVQGDQVAFLYRNNEDNLRDIRAAISTDGGESFTAFVDMDDLDWVLGACPSTGPSAMWAEQELRTAWTSGAMGDTRVYYSSVEAGSFSEVTQNPVHLAGSNEVQNHPSLAGASGVAGIAGELLISGQRNIFFSVSTDGYQSETYYVLTTEEAGNQVRPHMKFDGTGFHLVYSDNGGDAVNYRYITDQVWIAHLTNTPVKVFPQPATDFVRILLPTVQSKVQISIYDAQGRQVDAFTDQLQHGSVRIDLSTYPAGMMMICLTNERDSFRIPVIRL